jgi:putative transposase
MKAASMWLHEYKYIEKHEATEKDLAWLNRYKSTSEREKDKQAARKAKKNGCSCDNNEEKEKRKYVWKDAYWEIPMELWLTVIAPIIETFHPVKHTGAPRGNLLNYLNGVLWQLRTGAQFREIPRRFGHRWTIMKWRNRLCESGCLDAILEALKLEAERQDIVDYSVFAVDGCMVKSRAGGECVGPNPVDRKKGGVKRSIIVEGNGLPISIVIGSANTPDSHLFEETIKMRMKPSNGKSGGYFLIDRGYRGQDIRDLIEGEGYTYVAPEKDGGDYYALAETAKVRKLRKRRWKVERTHAWMNQYRGLLVRYGRKKVSYEAGLKIASILTWWRRIAP